MDGYLLPYEDGVLFFIANKTCHEFGLRPVKLMNDFIYRIGNIIEWLRARVA